jgi:hypothetical protein
MENLILPIVAIGISILTVVFLYFGPIVKLKEDVADLKSIVDLFRKGLEAKVIDMLKSYPTNLIKDTLLDKFKRRELTLDEAITLRTILCEEMRVDKEKALAYALALSLLEPVIHELKGKEK